MHFKAWQKAPLNRPLFDPKAPPKRPQSDPFSTLLRFGLAKTGAGRPRDGGGGPTASRREALTAIRLSKNALCWDARVRAGIVRNGLVSCQEKNAAIVRDGSGE